ncbi:MAG: hypothetical protein HUU06_00030 [Planctomycetaceae bacterium]|nr:hypothetical protein [Planctomycetaceae bacterium]
MVRTAVAIALAVTVIGGLGMWVVSTSSASSLRAQIEDSNRRQADRLAAILEREVASGIGQDQVLEALQKSLEAGPVDEAGYVCVMDAEGATLCQRGSMAESTVPAASSMVHRTPVHGTNWTVCVHTFEAYLRDRLTAVRRSVLRLGIPVGVLIALLGTAAARWAVRGYERRIEEANRDLETRVAARTSDLERALRDLSAAQESLVRNEKMVLLGQLVGSLAHELNNPLTAVIGYASLARMREKDPAVALQMAEIQKAAERCAALIRTFLSFARNQPPTPSVRDLNAIILDATRLIDGKLRSSRVTLELRLGDGLPPVKADPLQIEQVVVNLVNNARQALEGAKRRGTVTVRSAVEDGHLAVHVSDDGPGLPESVRAHLFEPFHTTKAEGQGTGLGLSICRRFVEAHGGRIALERTGPEGTEFRFDLPVAAGRLVPTEPSQVVS